MGRTFERVVSSAQSGKANFVRQRGIFTMVLNVVSFLLEVGEHLANQPDAPGQLVESYHEFKTSAKEYLR